MTNILPEKQTAREETLAVLAFQAVKSSMFSGANYIFHKANMGRWVLTSSQWGSVGMSTVASLGAAAAINGLNIGQNLGGAAKSALGDNVWGNAIGYGVQKTTESFISSSMNVAAQSFASSVDWSTGKQTGQMDMDWNSVLETTAVSGITAFGTGFMGASMGGTYDNGKMNFVNQGVYDNGVQRQMTGASALNSFANVVGGVAGQSASALMGNGFNFSFGGQLGFHLTKDGLKGDMYSAQGVDIGDIAGSVMGYKDIGTALGSVVDNMGRSSLPWNEQKPWQAMMNLGMEAVTEDMTSRQRNSLLYAPTGPASDQEAAMMQAMIDGNHANNVAAQQQTVTSKDTLGDIAAANNMSTDDLLKLNPQLQGRENYLKDGEVINFNPYNVSTDHATPQEIAMSQQIQQGLDAQKQNNSLTAFKPQQTDMIGFFGNMDSGNTNANTSSGGSLPGSNKIGINLLSDMTNPGQNLNFNQPNIITSSLPNTNPINQGGFQPLTPTSNANQNLIFDDTHQVTIQPSNSKNNFFQNLYYAISGGQPVGDVDNTINQFYHQTQPGEQIVTVAGNDDVEQSLLNQISKAYYDPNKIQDTVTNSVWLTKNIYYQLNSIPTTGLNAFAASALEDSMDNAALDPDNSQNEGKREIIGNNPITETASGSIINATTGSLSAIMNQLQVNNRLVNALILQQNTNTGEWRNILLNSYPVETGFDYNFQNKLRLATEQETWKFWSDYSNWSSDYEDSMNQ